MSSLDFTLNATPAAAIQLSGEWLIAIDPNNEGKSEEWFAHDPVRDAVPTQVPNPLELTFPGYNGVAWYWRSFDGEDLADYDDVRIRFGGADYFAEAWLNGSYIGGNESALLPFAFDAKGVLQPGSNTLVVRVIDVCYEKEIDGLQFPHVPGGRQHDDPLGPGWSHYNYGGLLLPVDVQAFQKPWIADAFIKPDIERGRIDVDLLLFGDRDPADWRAVIRPDYPNKGAAVTETEVEISSDSRSRCTISLDLPDAKLWDVWEGYLYELSLAPNTKSQTGTNWHGRFGMRQVSIVEGRLAVNGKPFLQRSYLYNQVWPVTLGVPFDDLARRDIEIVKESNANMLRCFSKTPVPATVEAADEVGILLQPETLGSWHMHRGDEEQKRLKNLTERTVLAYRNHPSIFWWNILNENSPVSPPSSPTHLGAFALREILPSIHELDPTRPAIANDPIWHDTPNIWEPHAPEPSLPLVQNHYYMFTGGLERDEESWGKQRGRAWGESPGSDGPFLGITEWGQCSFPDWEELMKSYRDSGLREDGEDYTVYQKLLQMNRDWYERSGVQEHGFPTFESVGEANRQTVAHRYREFFALFWGNTRFVGHGMTSLEDSSYEFSGVVDAWRNKKPLLFDTLTELNRPLQLNLWVRPSSIYTDAEITLDVTLVNERQRLSPGNYSLVVGIVDQQNQVVFQKKSEQKISGQVIEFLTVESIRVDVDAGAYELQVELIAEGQSAASNQAELCATRPIRVFDRRPRKIDTGTTVWVWEQGETLGKWLEQREIQARPGNLRAAAAGDILLVDRVDGADEVARIQNGIRMGMKGIFLRPDHVFDANPDSKPKPKQYVYSDLLMPLDGDWKPELRRIHWWGKPGYWGYGRAALALEHMFLNGLPQGVALEAQPEYQRVAPGYTWLLTDKPDSVPITSAVVEFCVHVDLPYSSDLMTLNVGEGAMVLNTLRIVEHLDKDPAADRILENLITGVMRLRGGETT